MKNTIIIDAKNSCACDLVSNVDDGTNTLFLEIHADVAQNPKLEIGGTNVTIDKDIFTYQVGSSYWVGTGTLQFRIVDDMHTGDYFNITKVSSLTGNIVLKQTDNFNYTLVSDSDVITTISDSDFAVINQNGNNKRFSILNLCKYVVEKLKVLVCDTLTTTNKTIPGAINELQSGRGWTSYASNSYDISAHNNVKLPTDWNELELSIWFLDGSSNEYVAYVGHISKHVISYSKITRVFIGGYMYNSSDYGSCWISLNPDNTFKIRHLIYVGTKYTNVSYSIRYR